MSETSINMLVTELRIKDKALELACEAVIDRDLDPCRYLTEEECDKIIKPKDDLKTCHQCRIDVFTKKAREVE